MRAKTTTQVESPEVNFALAGVCKECGNRTLNNDRAPAFKELQGYGHHEDENFIVCLACGSHHVDQEAHVSEDLQEEAFTWNG